MMRTLWKNEDYDTFVESICAHTVHIFIPDVGFKLYSSIMYEKINNIDKTKIEKPDWTLINIIKWFFPEKIYRDIKKDLIEDRQLLLKLYNCFPDD